MAQNVKFIKGNTAKISGTTIVDGQLLYDTTAGLHYIDNGSTRIQVGTSVDSALSTTSTNAIANNAITNSIINTTAEVSAITEDYIPCGTKPVKELITNLNDYVDGIDIRYNSSNLKPEWSIRGADTFVPFSSTRRNIITIFDTGDTSSKYLILKVEDTLSTKIVKPSVDPAYNDELIASVALAGGTYSYTLAVDCYVNEVLRSAGYIFTLKYADATTVYTVRAK